MLRHGRDGGHGAARAEGAPPEKPAPLDGRSGADAHREERRRARREALATEKRELVALLHAHGVSDGQLARWLGFSRQHVERMLSPAFPDVNFAHGARRLLPLSLQRALAHADVARLSGADRPAVPVELADARREAAHARTAADRAEELVHGALDARELDRDLEAEERAIDEERVALKAVSR